MNDPSKQYQQQAREQIQKTGAPHGVMQPEELAIACTKQWESVRTNISVEDRQKFEPILEALLARAAFSSPQSLSTLSSVVGSTQGQSS